MFKRWFRKKDLPQTSQLTTIHRDGTQRQVIHETSDLIEAPNWTPDGQWLVFNGTGSLFRIRADGSGGPVRIPTGAIEGVSNDHVVSPDGQTIYFTAKARIYAVPMQGGEARLVSNTAAHGTTMDCYLHGISADGHTLCYVGVASGPHGATQAIYTLPATGGLDTSLTPPLAAVDGPELSPDGQWVYFNAALNARTTGHAQIFRKRCDDTHIEQLTHDGRVNWFPHLSPDGRWVMYLSYPEKTQGHPANVEVALRIIPADGGDPMDVVRLRGGQGTCNVNGWAPDSQRLAYVAYPVRREGS